MEIRPDHLTLDDLFQKRLFRIPHYQRAYSWRSKQRKDLFEDIKRSFSKNQDDGHFMSTIVALKRGEEPISTTNYQTLEIVDGQQRITTLILLLKSIALGLNEEDDEEKEVQGDINETLVKPQKSSLILLQTNHDLSDHFATYLRFGTFDSPDDAKTLADKELLQAITDCKQFVETWIEEKKSLIELVSHLKNQLSFILHQINEEKIVYTVFEVLNSRGLEVSWFDRLKSMLMAELFEFMPKGEKDDILEEVHKLWTSIYRLIGLRSGLSIESLRYAATLKARQIPSQPLSEENAAAALRDLAIESDEVSKQVIQVIKWIQSVIQKVNELTQNNKQDAVTKITQARLLGVSILLRQDIENVDKQRILDEWEKVTFLIYGLSRVDARYERGSYVRLAWRIQNENLDVDSIFKEIGKIGKDYQFKQELLLNKNCYTDWKEELRYFFYKYEEFLSVQEGQNFTNEQWTKIWNDSAANSIEHIKPQGSKLKYIHHLGNLMLLPPKLNSKLKDDPPAQKLCAYSKTGLLLSGSVVKQLRRSSRWGQKEVKAREQELISWAENHWRRIS